MLVFSDIGAAILNPLLGKKCVYNFFNLLKCSEWKGHWNTSDFPIFCKKKAFLINESLHDIKNIIYYLGGKKKTILSFAGIGDLLLTCTSSKSRNFSFGYTIGSTNNKNSINSYLENNTVEGYYTLISVHELLNKKGISIELIDLMYDIIINNHDPKELAKFLIKKP